MTSAPESPVPDVAVDLPVESESNELPAESIARNTAFSFLTQLTTAALTAVLMLFLVRVLGPAEYGLFALALSVSSIALTASDLGISHATSRFVAERRDRIADVGTLAVDGLKLKVFVSVAVCGLLVLLADPIAGAYGEPRLAWPIRAMALATFGQGMVLMIMRLSIAVGRVSSNIRLVAAESLLEVSSSIALVLLGAGATGAAFGRAFGYCAGTLIGLPILWRLLGRPRLRLRRLPAGQTARRVGGYASVLLLIEAAFTLSSNAIVLLVGAYLGPAASGIFSAPNRLVILLQYVGMSAGNGVTPRLARGPGIEPNVAALRTALRGLIVFQCLLLAPIIVWSEPITDLLLGHGYSESARVLVALTPYIFFTGFAPVLTGGINYYGEAPRRVPIALATLALTFGGAVLLIPEYGLIGAAVTTDVAYGAYTLAHFWLCRSLLKLPLRRLGRALVSSLLAAAAMAIVLSRFGTARLDLFDWVFGGASGLAAYVAILLLTGELKSSDVSRAFDAIMRRMRRRTRSKPGR